MIVNQQYFSNNASNSDNNMKKKQQYIHELEIKVLHRYLTEKGEVKMIWFLMH